MSAFADAAAGDAKGAALVAWQGAYLEYAYRRPGGHFVAHPLRGQFPGDGADVTMNSSGEGVVFWDAQGRGVHGAVISGPRQRPALFFAHIRYCTQGQVFGGIDKRGDISVFCDNGDGRQIRYAVRRAGSKSFSRPGKVVSPSGERIHAFWVAEGANGAVTITWTDYNNVYAARGSATHGFTTTLLASDDNPSALYYNADWGVPNPSIPAVNAAGDTVVSFMEYTFSDDVLAATGGPGRTFHRPQLIAQTYPISGAFSSIDPQGRATVVWSGVNPADKPGKAKPGVFASTSSRTGVFGSTETAELRNVVQHPGAPCNPWVASDSKGDVFVVWNEYDGQIGGCEGSTGYEKAAIRPVDAHDFGHVTVISRTPAGYAWAPEVVATGHVGALAVWTQSNRQGKGLHVKAAQASPKRG